MWETLIKKLESIIDANDFIQETFIFEAEKFEGSPSVTITPSSNSSEYSSLEENERIYAFNIRIYINRTKAPSGTDVEYWCDERMREIVDSVLDDLDKSYLLDDVDFSGLTGYTFMNLFAIPSVWGYAEREDEFRVAEINVRARVMIDVNTIN